MIKKKFVSILIINYNNANFLERSINSCLNQTYKNFEILVYDDKSNDGSKLILEKYYKKKKIKFFINRSKKRTLKKNISEIQPNNNLTKSFSPSLFLKVRPWIAIKPVRITKIILINKSDIVLPNVILF